MRAAPGVHVEWVEDEAVVLNLSTRELHYLNHSAAVVYALILEHGLERALVEVKEQMNGVNRDEVDALISEMQENGLLVDD
jgi:hypothetical protein